MVDSRLWDTIATRTTTFCSLCGVFVDPWQDDLTIHPEFSWLNEVRAVRTTRIVSDPFVTGVGYLNFHQEVCAPEDEARRYDEAREPDEDDGDSPSFLKVHPHFNTSREYWCYVLHDACWELLRDRVDLGRQIPANTIGRHLFALLYNTPTNGEGTLVPGHDYGGAAQFQRPSRHGYFAVVNESKLPYLTGDPREPLQNDEHYLWEAIQAVCTPFKLPDCKLGNYSDSDVFCSLPNEIVMFILQYLASADLCNFRLASRYVADISSPTLLSQEFWASRFRPGFEMDFVFAGPFFPRPSTPVDWRVLYIKAKAALSDPDLFPGLQNRKRIWRNLHNLSDALQLRIVNEGWITGTPYRDTTVTMPPSVSLASSISADVVLGSESTGRLATRDLDVSCRLLETQMMSIPSEVLSQGLRLGVSYIYSNGRSYISGLRTLPHPGSKHSNEQIRAGFVNMSREEIVSFPPGSPLKTLEVAVAAKGITGFRFHKRGSQGLSVFSVGDLTPSGPNSGIGKLEISDKSSCAGIAVGLDACKIISISLVEKPNEPGLDSPMVVSVSEHLRHDVEIWNPTVPNGRPEWCPPHLEVFLRLQTFNLCLDMDFGGANGQLLRQLTRVVMIMGAFPAVFIGMAFIYSDGSRRDYGRPNHLINNTVSAGGVEQAFYIDGPNGEVIVKIMVSYFKDTTVQGISLFTNKGRSAEFRLCGHVDCGSYPYSLDYVTMEPKKGELFTAFCAKVKSPGNHFCAFGARSQAVCDGTPVIKELPPQNTDVAHDFPITPVTLASATEMLAYPRGFSFTAADLRNVKTIRVSLGEESRSRSEKNISGLWLEYHDSRTPSILGQWIREHECDSLELEPGDRVTQMTTWHDYTNSYRRVKFGPILKLRLSTVRGVTKEFLNPLLTNGKIRLVYRENPYEELHVILWGCNFEWDHVRALYAPKTGGRGSPGISLITVSLPGPRDPEGASWMVKEKAFMVETTRDGRPNHVVAIEMSYKDLSSEPAGLTLVYEDGAELTLGARGKRPQRLDVQPGETLTCMEIGLLRGNRVGTITFWTNTKRKLHFSDTHGIAQLLHAKTVYVLATNTTTKTLSPSELHKNDKEKTIISGSSSSASGSGNGNGVVTVDAPEEEVKTSRLEVPGENHGPFVGFWAVPKRRDRSLRYLLFGPIFETRRVGSAREGGT